jgi:hypothetical protein
MVMTHLLATMLHTLFGEQDFFLAGILSTMESLTLEFPGASFCASAAHMKMHKQQRRSARKRKAADLMASAQQVQHLTDGLASLTSRIFLCLSLTCRGAKISKKVKEVDAIYINACFIRGSSSTLIMNVCLVNLVYWKDKSLCFAHLQQCALIKNSRRYLRAKLENGTTWL